MAPKSLSPAAKQALIVQWFHNSLAAHSLKELEKVLPQVASIPQMQVKDYIQTLNDEGQIRVEKIGSGNWYWSFVSDAKKNKEKVLGDLQAEEIRLKTSIDDVENNIEEEITQREDDEDMLDEAGMDRKALLEAHATLLKENETIENELAGYSESDPTEILRKDKETRRLRESTQRWTDNLDAIEAFMSRESGNKEEVRRLMQQICGDEYIPGEGWKD